MTAPDKANGEPSTAFGHVHVEYPIPFAAAPAPKAALNNDYTNHSHGSRRKRRWYDIDRPHPLVWVAFGLSVLAVVLGVPKGYFPTFTGRHKSLRAQELLVQERLTLISQLSGFLPPPLATLFTLPEFNAAAHLDVVRLGNDMQVWQTQGRVDGNWWTLEDLGSGAQVVRTSTADRDREVWVLRSSESPAGADQALLAALTNSLMARERMYAQLDRAVEVRETCPPCPPAVDAAAGGDTGKVDKAENDKWSYIEEQRRHLRDRTHELEEREQDVIRREMWVVDALRKLSDRSHNSAAELEMEGRVVERLKAFQRQTKVDKI